MLVLDKVQSDGANSLPFWLGRNNLTGVIPFTLGNLSFLQQLSVAFNHLEGGIPHDLRTLMGILTNSLSANALPNKLRVNNLDFFNGSIAQSSGSGASSGFNVVCLVKRKGKTFGIRDLMVI